MFKIEKRLNRARLGRLSLPSGEVMTPVFMPVATGGTVKTLTQRELDEIGVQMIVCNTYHLYLRPGVEVIKEGGGLNKFIGFTKPILTDSGGFQITSLAELVKITEEGVYFQSHIDGSKHFLTPEKVAQIQKDLLSDIGMCLDCCLGFPLEYKKAREAMVLTTQWARRTLSALHQSPSGQRFFAIVQGGTYLDLRRESAVALIDLDFPGYAIGGLFCGEPSSVSYEIINLLDEILPGERPRYAMGAGYPEDIIECVRAGVDIFDCVLPTRNGRTGTAFTSQGRVLIRNAQYAKDFSPLEEGCECYTCTHFSRAYLRHLFLSEEILGQRLLTYHNLFFYMRLMRLIREAILEERLDTFAQEFLAGYSRQDTEYRRQDAGYRIQ